MKHRAACLVFAALPFAGAAQTTETADPIRCWWKTSRGSLAIGEPFDVTLTCAVREGSSTRTIVDESRLVSTVVQLAPFEVLRGTHPADLRTSTHRFFQYQYTLRIIDRDAIGRDARFPDLQVAYRVADLVGGEWSEGRERFYAIPGRSVRVHSLVPLDASDIRDSGPADFAAVETLRFRARALQILAVMAVALACVLAIPTVVSWRRRSATVATESRVSRHAVLRHVLRALTEVQQQSRRGWSSDLVARATQLLRVAAAALVGGDVAQRHPADGDALLVPRKRFGRDLVAVSSPFTAADVDRADDAATAVYHVAAALRTFTEASYGRADTFDQAALDMAMENTLITLKGARR